MDRNTIVGFVLIFGILIAWQQFMKPSAEELAEQERIQDSLLQDQLFRDSVARLELNQEEQVAVPQSPQDSMQRDSQQALIARAQFGPFAPIATGTEQTYTLANDLLKLTFTNKGGRIREAELLEYKKIVEGEDNQELELPLRLLEDPKNKFGFQLPLSELRGGKVSTEDLYFEASSTDQSITFRAAAGPGQYFEQEYRLTSGSYNVEYEVRLVNLNSVIDGSAESFELNWVNYLDKLEKNVTYERNYSTIYYKTMEEDVPDHCSCTSDDLEELDEESLKWISNTNQFFNSTLIAKEQGFKSAQLETVLLGDESEDLKKLVSDIQVPIPESGAFKMDLYVGPNEFKRLAEYGLAVEDVIPYGSSIFGTINRWVIRPMFNWLSNFIGSKGVAILLLTLVVKLLLYPLQYRMLYSQAKMGALKPVLAGLKDKYKDDSQKQQMETMKIYQEYGVNPLGGCLPTLLQLPIWFALYRFFPASLEFRQESFLWATDLSSYDVAFSLPFEVPFYGDHVSLFTILWAATTILYAYYNSKHMDMSANPAMKYMQYFMPLMFLFFFNSYAAGLTCYLFFSSALNVTQTLVTKNIIIDENKIKAELEANKKKPKKKNRLQSRFQDALKEQQRIQAERETQQKNKRKK
ncbi:MAG: membrane protein insertase YidC [Phaeodactylibacter sp.]|nr:membrane protein insertase YidC [Phaeodactylibacter sp.]